MFRKKCPPCPGTDTVIKPLPASIMNCKEKFYVTNGSIEFEVEKSELKWVWIKRKKNDTLGSEDTTLLAPRELATMKKWLRETLEVIEAYEAR